jgi:hypothetical protein
MQIYISIYVYSSTYGEMRNAYKLSIGNPEGKSSLGRPRRRWEYNSKMNLTEIGWGGMDWFTCGRLLTR